MKMIIDRHGPRLSTSWPIVCLGKLKYKNVDDVWMNSPVLMVLIWNFKIQNRNQYAEY